MAAVRAAAAPPIAPPEGRSARFDPWPSQWLLAVVVLITVLAMQTMRVLFTVAYGYAERTSFLIGSVFILIVFLSPLPTPLVRRALGPRWSLPAAAVGLAGSRIALQAVQGGSLILATAGTVFSLVAWTLSVAALRELDGGRSDRFVTGFLLGLAIDNGVRAAFLTWDHAWQGGAMPWVLTILLAGGLVFAAWRAAGGEAARVDRMPGFGSALPVALLGPFLALQVLMLGNVALVASQGSLSVAAAAAVALAGNVVALGSSIWTLRRRVPLPLGMAAGLAIAVVVLAVTRIPGGLVVVPLVAGQALAGGLLGLALSRAAAMPNRSLWRTSAASTLGSLAFIAVVLGYQIHYEFPLPIPNVALPMLAGVLLGVGAVGSSSRVIEARSRGPALAMVAATGLMMIVIPVGLAVNRPGIAVNAGAPTFRLVSYNVHSAVNTEGNLDPEAVAAVIEGQRPDVVLLQEVSRGWPIAGTIDLGEWLSRRLRMPYAWGPAADRQFGNMMLSRFPIVSARTVLLPRGVGTMERGYLRSVIDLGDGRTMTAIVTHFAHRAEHTSARLLQADRLLGDWAGAPRTIIAGDLNSEPDTEVIRRFLDAGLVSAQDATGNGHLPTSGSPNPDHRIDYVFGTPEIGWSNFVIPRSLASDHLALAVTVTIPQSAPSG
jgi:endonuclease/exonuclease/phosphatase family metal-dependent hydrolase